VVIMKRTLIAATVAALTIPVGFTAPAQANTLNDEMAVSVNNTWGLYDLSVYVKVTCSDGTTSSIGSPDALMVVPAGEQLGEAPSCSSNSLRSFGYEFTVSANGDTSECVGGTISNSIWNYLYLDVATETVGGAEGKCRTNESDDANIPFNFVALMKTDAGNYNLQINPMYLSHYTRDLYLLGENPPQAIPSGVNQLNGDVSAANDFRVKQARSKDTSYVTVNAKRMTAVAQRFVNHPGDVINIHGYGPDRKAALAKAHHIRGHLLSEITRLGGDVSTHPVVAIYAGDPAHKQGVDVTVHQHSVRSIHNDGS